MNICKYCGYKVLLSGRSFTVKPIYNNGRIISEEWTHNDCEPEVEVENDI